MPADEAKLSATRPRPSANYAPPPPGNQPTSPWIPFVISFLLIAGAAGGLFYYMDMQFKNLEGKLLKTNDFVINMDKRLKTIEDNIAASDAEAEEAGSSLTSKVMNLEARMVKAEKGIGWNSSRIGKQESTMESLNSSVRDVNSSMNAQASKISGNTSKIAELNSKFDTLSGEDPTAALSAQVHSNQQAIETIDAHRSRMSSAIQQVQSDVARLIRLYEKDNPSAKRVH